MFLRKRVLKMCFKFTGEHPSQSAISIKLQSSFFEITLRHGCSPVNLLDIFRTQSTIMKELGQGNFILGKTTDTKVEQETNFTSQIPSDNEPLVSSFIFTA